MAKDRIIDVQYSEFIHETPNGGCLFLFDGDGVWLPRSAIEIDEKDKVITLPERLAIEKEIEGYAI